MKRKEPCVCHFCIAEIQDTDAVCFHSYTIQNDLNWSMGPLDAEPIWLHVACAFAYLQGKIVELNVTIRKTP